MAQRRPSSLFEVIVGRRESISDEEAQTELVDEDAVTSTSRQSSIGSAHSSPVGLQPAAPSLEATSLSIRTSSLASKSGPIDGYYTSPDESISPMNLRGGTVWPVMKLSSTSIGGSKAWEDHADLLFQRGKDKGDQQPQKSESSGLKVGDGSLGDTFDLKGLKTCKEGRRGGIDLFQSEHAQNPTTPTEVVNQIVEQLKLCQLSLNKTSVELMGKSEIIRTRDTEIDSLLQHIKKIEEGHREVIEKDGFKEKALEKEALERKESEVNESGQSHQASTGAGENSGSGSNLGPPVDWLGIGQRAKRNILLARAKVQLCYAQAARDNEDLEKALQFTNKANAFAHEAESITPERYVEVDLVVGQALFWTGVMQYELHQDEEDSRGASFEVDRMEEVRSKFCAAYEKGLRPGCGTGEGDMIEDWLVKWDHRGTGFKGIIGKGEWEL